MAWTMLQCDGAKVTVMETGRIRWNDAAHVTLRAPVAILLFHDAENNRLGFQELRSLETNPHALAVYESREDTGPQAGRRTTHHIEAQDHLAAAGIEIESDHEVVLQGPVALPELSTEPRMHWIELPA